MKLQNNFTTPEQSRRLLELGVPADSADCYFCSYGGHPDYVAVRQTEFETEDDALFRLNDNLLPCWSVGRLIEILCICSTTPFPNEIIITHIDVDLSIVKKLINRFEELVNYYSLDFSKLEDWL